MTAPPSADHTALAFGPFVLDAAQGALRKEGLPVALTGRPLAVLALLAAHPQRLWSKGDLLDAVWGHRHVTESVLKVAVNTLRATLGDDAKSPCYIETVPRLGYRFVAQVQPALPDLPKARASASPATSQGSAAAPGNLPKPGATLVGRQAEAVHLLALLQAHRLVTVTGLGGIGKTRLALTVAAQLAAADGVWLVRLDELQDPAGLVSAVAQALRLPDGAGTDAPALARALHTQDLCLVLDNAEHLVDGVASLVDTLLQGAPDVAVLVTSQQPLRLAEEQLLPLAPLGLPGDVADAAPTPAYAAAELFCQRVRQQQPGYVPSLGDHADIAAICRALDGVPLALELAAARVPLLGMAGVRARLDERFALLTRAPRDAAARHRTLAAALDWTYKLLSAEHQTALQRLSVFPASFTANAAEAVLSDPDRPDPEALDTVDALLHRSLLVGQDSAPGSGTTPRLRLFDSVRRYAQERLAQAGQEQPTRLRHLAWMRRRFEAADEIEFDTPLLQWLPPLRADIESLRTALQFGLDPAASDAARDDAQRLMAASTMFWARSGNRREARKWLDAASALPCSGHTATLLAHALGSFGVWAQLGSPAQAQQALRRARPALRAAGDQRRLYLSLYFDCLVQPRVAAGQDMQPLLQEMRACQDPAWGALARRFLDVAESQQLRALGDMKAYQSLTARIAARCRAAGGLAECWPMENAQAQALALQGQLDAACQLLADTVAEVQAAGWLREQVPLLAMAASLHLWRDGSAAALALARQATRLLLADGMVWWMADALAWAAWHDGRPADARRLQAWADAQVRQRGDARGPVFKAMQAGLLQAMHPGEGVDEAEALVEEAAPLDASDAVSLALGDCS